MEIQLYETDGQMTLLCPECEEEQRREKRTPASKRQDELISVPYLYLDMTPGHCDLLGEHHWELHSPWREGRRILNTGVAPRKPINASLSEILQDSVPERYYLSRTACLGILRRANERGKELPPQLKAALMAQAGLASVPTASSGLKAYHINQRDEGIDLGEVSGALMATTNMQMQTFVTQPEQPVGFDGYNGDLTGDKAATLGVNCGMSTGRNGLIQPIAFAANQRDEVRDLHDVAGALQAQPGMKQQTFIASGVVSKGDGDCFLMRDTHPALTSGGGQAGQGYPCVMTAGFCAGAAPTAGGIGWQEECSPTLKAAESGTNMVPSILCLNDQGGSIMECTEDMTGTLRAQEHGHQPLVFENHGIDARYTGPHLTVPTLSARAGTGGNNLPLVADTDVPSLCIAGNIIDRQPQNGGNGLGCQEEIAYTLTATDRHAVFSRQRVDVFKDDDVASTQSARQHKDATDLVMASKVFGQSQYGTYAEGCSTLRAQGGDNGGGSENLVAEVGKQTPLLIRRLTPLECERLQGFPDVWTELSATSDSARYKALGNSVAIPCVEYVMRGIALALLASAISA